MTNRDDVIRDFLNAAGWGEAIYAPMTSDASFRSYVRLRDPAQTPATAILMNAPPDTNNPVTEFTDVAEVLTSYGYSAPQIYTRDVENGLLLIEDLGDDLFARLCERDPALELPLYQAAVELLIDLSQRPAPDGMLPYSPEVYRREALLLADWYIPAAQGEKLSQAAHGDFAWAVTSACEDLPHTDPVLVCRDYHAENLLWLPDRSGLARVGLLDFQDALAGHPAYDLVSLLEDARRDTSAALRATMIDRFVSATGMARAEFDLAYCTLGAQRNMKILGIFARLHLRDGKRGYLDLMPRVWDHLMRDLSHPALEGLKTWVMERTPAPTPEVLTRIRDHQHEA